MKVRYSPLPQQYEAPDEILAEIREVVAAGAYTLGPAVGEFEDLFADLVGARHAVGVGTGTDSLKLPLRALDIGHGDEVITCANTFIATVGAIAEVGAVPVFIDCTDSFCLDVDQIEAAVTPKTKAIMPVHMTGEVADMPAIMEIAQRHGLPVIEDACQSMLSELDGRQSGSWGIASGYSMHPLKLLNVWGDAGVVITNDDAMARSLRLLRNHGLRNRDEIEILGYNTRLDTVQAVVAKWIVRQAQEFADRRAEKARFYDAGFANVGDVRIPTRRTNVKHTYLLYILFVDRRDELLAHCIDHGIEAKVHYPIPLYQQQGLAHFGYRAGDFPVTDRHAQEMISFPVDQYLTDEEQSYVIETVKEFYA